MKLPSPDILENLVIRIFSFYSFVCAYPYKWKWNSLPSEHVTLLQHRLKLWIFYFVSLTTWLYWPYLMFTLGMQWQIYIKEQRIVHLILHCAWLAVYGTCISGQYFATFQKRETISLTNSTVFFCNALEGKFKGFIKITLK